MGEDRFDQCAKFRRAGQIRTPARHIDAGENNLGIIVSESADLFDHRTHRHGTRIAAPIRDDAKGAAMIAAILYLDESARAPFEMLGKLRRCFTHGHNIGDTDALGIMVRITQGSPCRRARLFLIADDAVDFRHGRKHVRINLRSATRHYDARLRMFALQATNGLAGLSHRLARNGACIDDGKLTMACRFSRLFHRFGFRDVESAAKGQKIDAHQAVSKIAGSNWPACSSSTGPAIKT